MSSNYDAIVIGSGLGGLTAGALYAKQGKKVIVLERHLKFGGAATTFNRKGIKAEVGLHEIDGLDDGDFKIGLVEQLGLKKAMDFIPTKNFYAVRHSSLTEEFVMPEGIEQAIEYTISYFPFHKKAIQTYFKTLQQIRKSICRYSTSNRTIAWWVLNGPIFPLRFWPLLRFERITVGNYLQKLFGDNESIKLALCANFIYYTDDLYKLSILFYGAAQASFHVGGSYYIKGGSQVLSDYLIAIIKEAGGDAYTQRSVTKILIENDKTIGVEHEKAEVIAKKQPVKDKDPQQVFAPVIFGNAAPHELKKMLPENYQEPFMKPYQDKSVSTSLWTIYLAFDQNPSNFGVNHYSTFIIPDWLSSIKQVPKSASLFRQEATDKMPGFVFVDYSALESELTEDGRYFAVMTGLDHIDNWINLDEGEYQNRKNQWMENLITFLDKTFPGISERIIYKEMATARTVQDYLNTPGGAVYGFAQEPKQGGRFRPQSQTAVNGLLLTSAYAFPGGGFTGAMSAGENAIRYLKNRTS